MTLAEEIHAERKARLARLNQGKPVIPSPSAALINQIKCLEDKLSQAELRIVGLESLIAQLRRAITTLTGPAKAPRIEYVILVVADHFNIPPATLPGRGGSTRYSYPRQVVYYISQQFGYSLPTIGRALGRDHSTVLHGSHKVEVKAKRHPELAALLVILQGKVVEMAKAKNEEFRAL